MPHYSPLQIVGLLVLGAVTLGGVGWLDWQMRITPALAREKDRKDKDMGLGAYRHPPLSLDGLDSPPPNGDEL